MVILAGADRGPSLYTRRSFLGLVGGGALAVAVGACGSTNGEGDASPALADAAVTAFTIVAERIRWDLDRIVVPVGEEVTATIENRDRGMPHNLHVKSPGNPRTELQNGVVTQTLRFRIEKRGRYTFVCDAHATMTGTIEAI